MEIKNNLALIGMPAVGKSTVGVLLAKKMGYAFQDTDILIQTQEGMTLAQIIEAKGRKTFLDIEARHLMGLGCSSQVIATGGSVIYREAAMIHLAQMATIVYLSVDLPVLMTRLSDLEARGVAIGPGRGVDDLYKERTPLYDKFCDIKIDCGQMWPDQVVSAVFEAVCCPNPARMDK
ncbi:MAG: shikimate kinase [Desulfobacter sp.]|nr:shikimate kinase [Desulfobacter sp.]WDP84731.1 MAG: shikimate kinase [Desulfobacter sp.]